MGSFRASFEFGGKEFDVLNAEYILNRNTDDKGKPSSSVKGGRVTLTLESTADTSVIEAMVNNQFKAVEGKILFKKTDQDSKMLEVGFKNAYIVYFKEELDVNNEVPMKFTVTFSAEELSIGNAVLENRWAKN